MAKCVGWLAIIACLSTVQFSSVSAKGPRFDPFPVRAAPYNPFDYTDLLEKLKDATSLSEDDDHEKKMAHSLAWGQEVLNKVSELTTVTDKQVEMAVLDGFWEEMESHFGVEKKNLMRTVRNCHTMPIRKDKLQSFYKGLEENAITCASSDLGKAKEINKKLVAVSDRLNALYESKKGCMSENFQQMMEKAKYNIRIRRLAPLLVMVLTEVAIQVAVVVISKLVEVFWNWLKSFWKCVSDADARVASLIQRDVSQLAQEATVLVHSAWQSTKTCVKDVVSRPKRVRLRRLMDKCRSMVVYGSNEAQVTDYFGSSSVES